MSLLTAVSGYCRNFATLKPENMLLAPRIKIITVDDSALIAERLKLLLTETENVDFLGSANNIATALYLIKELHPNVVILDINLAEDMPNANGIFLLITLREKYPDLKIIMLTNHSGPKYRSACISHGANCFLDKSLEMDKILDTLKTIL